jgi:hypothetical protein
MAEPRLMLPEMHWPHITQLQLLRLCALLVPAAAIGVPFAFPRPHPLPTVAFGTFAFLHVEETFALLVTFSALIAFAFRVWGGELPIKTSHEGLEYANVLRQATVQLAGQTDLHQVELDAIRKRVALFDLTRKEVTQLGAQVDALARGVTALEEQVDELTEFVTRT